MPETTSPLPDEFGIYVHWPFCLSKCPYCDFNSHVRASIDESAFENALLCELDHYAGLTSGRTVTSIFFGGGTPSLMPPKTVAAVLDRIAARWPLDPGLEVTLEANPTSVEADRFAGFRDAGVNRVSLGVQSLDDAELRFLGRGHSAAEAIAAIALARAAFPRMSFDLIYARPNQTVESWENELRSAIDLAADHLSLYQLTIEEGTAFHNIYRRGGFVLPDDDVSAALYDVTQSVTAAAGLPSYEVSNHARPGAECRHNLLYWRYGDYLGIGAGAHGRITRDDGTALATFHLKKPEDWLNAVRRDGHGSQDRTELPVEERAIEMILMGLRLRDGIDLDRFAARIGRPLQDFLDRQEFPRLVAEGYLELTGNRLSTTPKGAVILNWILGRIVA